MAIRRVVCGMSGGVDSAVAALLLKRKGFEVVGAFMKNWDVADETGVCTSDADREDAADVCRRLDITLHDANFVKEYWTEVFSHMLQGYETGTTPNPDVLCNRHVKFGHFYKYARETLGCDAIATGHYARNSYGDFLENIQQNKGADLLKARDSVKDQTLFLCQIHQLALRRTMFPLGSLYKHQVRQIAREAGLDRVASKKESMGICFIGSRNFHSFIDEYLEPKPGNFVHRETGEILGTHKGTHYWTVGQRSLIGGMAEPYFIAKVDPKTQDIYVVPGTRHPALFTMSLTLSHLHWINDPPHLSPHTSSLYDFRFQHLHPAISCSLRLHRAAQGRGAGEGRGKEEGRGVGDAGMREGEARGEGIGRGEGMGIDEARIGQGMGEEWEGRRGAGREVGRGKEEGKGRREGVILHVGLSHPLRAITVGQYGVLYNREVCMGSGLITSPGPSLYDLNYRGKVMLKHGFS